jgi:phosphatidylglycerol:prolipoprotein diacylglycerol transferase
MHPELFKIPFTNLTVWTYGALIVFGFLVAVHIIRRLSRDITPNPDLITNAALYSLIAGVVGARVFYVVHYFENFKDNLLSVFAIWNGGLELLGGVILAITVIILYLRYHKLPVRKYLDILAIGLLGALAFGRIGCFMKGCCFGKPTKCPMAVRFPYSSDPYISQVRPDLKRNREEPYLKLPPEYFGFFDESNNWIQIEGGNLKPLDMLTDEQKYQVTKGDYRCLPVHPTQLYSSADAVLLCVLLYLFWRRSQNAASKNYRGLFTKPGSTFALMFILYGIARFLIEYLRDGNPFEYAWWTLYKGGTVSQNMGIYMVILGVVMMAIFQKLSPGIIIMINHSQKKGA